MKTNSDNKFLGVISRVVAVLLMGSFTVFAQKKDNEEKNYPEAEAKYRIEKSKSENKSSASYNLGNTIYKQESYEESKYSYIETIENSQDKAEKHRAYHNLGNALMQEKNYQAAVDAYKNALRNNPYDEETRYNFALAKEMLDKNPPPEDQNQNEDQNQDQNQEDQNKENQKGGDDQDENQDNQDQNQDNQDGGDNQDNQDQQGDGNQDQEPEGNQGGMPKQRIENLLDAVENQEKGIQQRVQKRKELEERKGQPRQSEKNW